MDSAAHVRIPKEPSHTRGSTVVGSPNYSAQTVKHREVLYQPFGHQRFNGFPV